MTTLDTPRSESLTIKLPNQGDGVQIALVDMEERPLIKFGTQEIEVGTDGRPRTQDVLTGVLLQSAGGACVGPEDARRVPQPGEVVTIYAAKGTRWNLVEAKKAYNNEIRTGTVVSHWFDNEEAPQVAGQNGRKNRLFAFADQTDGAMTAHCDQLHQARRSTALGAPVAAVPAQPAGVPFGAPAAAPVAAVPAQPVYAPPAAAPVAPVAPVPAQPAYVPPAAAPVAPVAAVPAQPVYAPPVAAPVAPVAPVAAPVAPAPAVGQYQQAPQVPMPTPGAVQPLAPGEEPF